ncbi:MAG TPA: DNA replication and repair protein RecF, partial [Anaerolineaceae bacterium]|nr:DNA replication and repair protein RecF [Anaerolineaceae bacterium]HQP08703.1 DNA replication and repair protein RecF [Anaerolineaceae bacterium]
MYLSRLSLTNFRIFSRLDIDVPRQVTLLVGDNGQGKTTVLEAVYFLSTFTSFQASFDRQLISFSASAEPLAVARIVAEFIRADQPQKMEIRIIQESNGNGGLRSRKEILVNNIKRSAQESVGFFNSVLFLPQMMRILEGGPDERRRYLNLMISQAIPGYAQALSDYHQAVTQRNALLKQLGERGGDPDQLIYWDELISRRGAQIMQARIRTIKEIEKIASQLHLTLTQNQEVLRLSYQPAYDPASLESSQAALPMAVDIDRENFSLEEISSGMMNRLNKIRHEEITRGTTTIGPHRDEMRVLSNRIDLSDYGSRGQVRTALLALKLAEVQWLYQKAGSWPVLLLDETVAE